MRRGKVKGVQRGCQAMRLDTQSCERLPTGVKWRWCNWSKVTCALRRGLTDIPTTYLGSMEGPNGRPKTRR